MMLSTLLKARKRPRERPAFLASRRAERTMHEMSGFSGCSAGFTPPPPAPPWGQRHVSLQAERSLELCGADFFVFFSTSVESRHPDRRRHSAALILGVILGALCDVVRLRGTAPTGAIAAASKTVASSDETCAKLGAAGSCSLYGYG